MKNLITVLVVLISCAAKAAVGDSVLVYRGNSVVQTNLSYVVSNLTVNGSFLNTNQFSGNSAIKSGALLTNTASYGTNYAENLTVNSGANTVSLAITNNNGKIQTAHDGTWNYLQSITSSGSNSKDLLVSGQSAGNIGLLQLNATTNMLLNGSLA